VRAHLICAEASRLHTGHHWRRPAAARRPIPIRSAPRRPHVRDFTRRVRAPVGAGPGMGYHLPGEHWRITSGYWSILRSSIRLSQRWVAGVSACEPRLIRMSRRSRPRIIGVCSDNRRLSVCVEHRHRVGWSQLFVSAACGCRCARCSSRKRCAEGLGALRAGGGSDGNDPPTTAASRGSA
jgi:hypothetical protein